MQWLHRFLRTHGVDVIRYPKGTSDGLAFFELATAQGVQTVLDVGANVGQFARILRGRGFEGRIISFEPGEAAFAELTRAARDDVNWITHRLALGSTNGSRELFVPPSSELASFLPASDRGRREFGAAISDTRAELVETRRLDSVFEELVGPDERVMLKVDTQGSDQEVLEGATGALHRVVGIQTELAIHDYYAGVPSYLARLQWLDAQGYHPVALSAVRCEGSTLMELDCLVVRLDKPEEHRSSHEPSR